MTEEKNFQTARKEAVAAAPRPTQLGMASDEIADAVRTVRELDDTHLTYSWQWITMFTGVSDEECTTYFEAKLLGRVEEHRLVDWPGAGRRALQVRLPNPVGEWKTAVLAQAHCERLFEDDSDCAPEVVVRNSRPHHVLKDYGKKKLPKKAEQ